MKIAEIDREMNNVEVEGEIISLSSPVSVRTKFGNKKVANGKIKDDSGEIDISLWNEQADMFTVGDKVKITNGYVKEFRGKLQIGVGRNGKIEKVE